jgi:hypothetical protein
MRPVIDLGLGTARKLRMVGANEEEDAEDREVKSKIEKQKQGFVSV